MSELTDWAAPILGEDTCEHGVIADASTRTYVRLRGASNTYMVMNAPGQADMIERFERVAHCLRVAGLNVPVLHAVDAVAGRVLMSDFGDTTYLQALSTQSPGPLYEDAIDTLVTMQAHADASLLVPYDRAELMREMNLFPEWYLRRHLGLVPEPPVLERLTHCFESLCDVASTQPRVFVHRDYHSRNLMVVDTDGPGVLDFQDALQGPATYDLASLLRDVYVEWPAAQVEEWVGYYLHRRGVPHGRRETERFTRELDLMGLQRHLKIAGLFVRLHLRDGKPGYMADVPLTVKYIRATCERYAELDVLSRLLDELGVEGS